MKQSRKKQLEIVQSNIRNLRIARGWNVLHVAELTGIPVEDLIAIEDGADCRLDYLRTLSNLYCVRMSAMFRPLKQFVVGHENETGTAQKES